MLLPQEAGLRGPGRYVPPTGGGGEGDPGSQEPPIVTTVDDNVTINGKIKPGSFGKIIVPLSAIAANRRYTFRVVANFSQLARRGQLAMVGAGFKNGNDFHIAGLRGDGSTGTDEYIVHGTAPNGWNKLVGHTEVNGGDAASGTQHSAYYQLTISTDGTTYTLATGTDGVAWTTIFAGQALTPFANVSAVTSFGVALWFNNADAGAYSATVSEFADEEASIDFSFVGQNNLSSTTIPVNFGAAHANRYIFVSIAASRSTGSNQDLTAVTIGGVAASKVISHPASGVAQQNISVWYAVVPTGTSGNVVITTSGYDTFSVAAYRVVGLQSVTPDDSGSGFTTGGAISLDIPAGGFGIGLGNRLNSTPITLSGLTTDYTSARNLNDTVHGSKTSSGGETVSVDVNVNESTAAILAASFR